MAEGRLPFERTVILLDTNKSYAEHEVADLTFGALHHNYIKNPIDLFLTKTIHGIKIFYSIIYYIYSNIFRFQYFFCSSELHNILSRFTALKSRKEGSFMAKKTVQTLCVERISEYCRVMYDIFPEDALVLPWRMLHQKQQ